MTTPITLASKDPSEKLAYTWTPQVGDTIASGLAITPTDGTATLDGSPTQIEDGASARFVLQGGAHGEVTKLTAIATMASGDVIEQEIRIPIISSGRRCIDLALAKQHLEYDDDDRDTLIQQYIDAAQDWVEGYTGKLLTRRAVTQRFNSCDTSTIINCGPDPVIGSLTYLDSDLEEVTIDAADYRVIGGKLYPVTSWPYAKHGIEATVTAGYDGDVPAALISAQLLIIGHLFNQRETVSDKGMTEVPIAAKALAGPYCSVFV